MTPKGLDWIDENSWPRIAKELLGLSQLTQFMGFFEYFIANGELFKPLYDATDLPEKLFPEEWEIKLNDFQKIMFLKAFRPDLVTQAVTRWVAIKMG